MSSVFDIKHNFSWFKARHSPEIISILLQNGLSFFMNVSSLQSQPSRKFMDYRNGSYKQIFAVLKSTAASERLDEAETRAEQR